MSNLVWPMPIGGYVKHREPFTDVIVDTAASGKEYRQTWQLAPRYKFTIAVEVLNGVTGGRLDLQKTIGFLSRHYQSLDSFLLTDPEDNAATTHAFGVGNGTITDFQLQRTLVADADLATPASRSYWPLFADGYEPVFELNGSPSIFVDAVAQTLASDFTLPGLGIAHFVVRTPAAPALTPSTTGGSLATATYFVKLTALGTTGETLASTEASAAVTGPTGSIAATWTAVAGATGYRVYVGTTTGGENQFFAPGNVTSFAITTATGTAGSQPGAATATRSPANGAILTWTGSFYRRVRLDQPGVPLDFIAQSMWSSGLQLISVKP